MSYDPSVLAASRHAVSVKKIEPKTDVLSVFGGINRHERIGEGWLRDDLNMTSAEYPTLCVRPDRGYLRYYTSEAEGYDVEEIYHRTPGVLVDAAVIDGDVTLATGNGHIMQRGRIIDLGDDVTRLIPTGRNIYVIPAGVLIPYQIPEATVPPEPQKTAVVITDPINVSVYDNTTEDTLLSAEGVSEIPDPTDYAEGDVVYDDSEGIAYYVHGGQWTAYPNWVRRCLVVMGTAPASPVDGMHWADTSTDGYYVYNGDSSAFEAWEDFKVAISTAGPEFAAFSINQAVTISGTLVPHLDGDHAVLSVGSDGKSIVITGIIDPSEARIYQDAIVERRMPVLDFAIEHENRIWGCRYGENDRGEFVNEIYCSALGDVHHWLSGRGLVEDPFTASVGAPGEFTGCGVVGDHVVFYKESCFFSVYGTYPAEYSVVKTDCEGIQMGCARSAVSIGGSLYYKGVHGIMRHDTYALPVNISDELGTDLWSNATGGTDGRRYYLNMTKKDGEDELYVYDTYAGIWHREDTLPVVRFFFRYRNNCVCVNSKPCDETLWGSLVPAYLYVNRVGPIVQFYKLFKLAWDNITVRDETTRHYVTRSIEDIEVWMSTVDPEEYPPISEYTAQELVDAATLDMSEYYQNDFTYMNYEAVRDTDIPAIAQIYDEGASHIVRTGGTVKLEREFRTFWIAETGSIGLADANGKGLKGFEIRAKLYPGSEMDIAVMYNDDGRWRQIRHTEKAGMDTWKVEGGLADCDTYRLRFSGSGKAVVYSVVNMYDRGDDRIVHRS